MDACAENKQPKEEGVDHKNTDTEETKTMNKPHPCTPAVVRTRQSRKDFQVSSPSDAIMSPCTQRLFGRSRLNMGHGAHPGALLKEKQRSALTQMEQDKELGKVAKFNCDD
uniref:Zgc: n=1 Tax=Syphacia muris TaxID=451379 RepID=A0A0N5A8C8_9BILA